MQLLDWAHLWTPRGPGNLRKILRFQVGYIKTTRNQALVHKSNVVGDLNIVVKLKLREGMHFSQSKNAGLLNFSEFFALRALEVILKKVYFSAYSQSSWAYILNTNYARNVLSTQVVFNCNELRGQALYFLWLILCQANFIAKVPVQITLR